MVSATGVGAGGPALLLVGVVEGPDHHTVSVHCGLSVWWSGWCPGQVSAGVVFAVGVAGAGGAGLGEGRVVDGLADVGVVGGLDQA